MPRVVEETEKKTVPVNILLTEEGNLALSKFALQASTAEERISKSDVVRTALEAGLPLFDFVQKLAPGLPITEVPALLTRKPVIEAVEQLVRERGEIRARGAVRTRGGIRTRGGAREEALGPVASIGGSAEGIELVAPVSTGVQQAPTLSWKLSGDLIKAHLSAKPSAPIRCRVSISDDTQEVWEDHLEITLPRGAKAEEEAQRVRSLALPREVFEQLAPGAWQRWTVQVTYQSSSGPQTGKAWALFFKVPFSQAARAVVEGGVAQGRAYETQGLLEEAARFFRESLETSCQQLVAIYQQRGLPQAEAYQKLLEDITKLR